MKRVNVRTFRAEFARLSEPVEVIRHVETLGVFIPRSETEAGQKLGMAIERAIAAYERAAR